jgi:two-component system, sensor histidine kinase RegB
MLSPAFNSNTLHLNLYRLFIIRVLVFCLQLLALIYARYYINLALNYPLVVSVLALLAFINGSLFLRLRRASNPNQLEFFLHLLVDVFGLSLLLYFTGGANNPFVSYFLVPITIAAAALPWTFTALLSLYAVTSYSVLLYWFEPLPALMPSQGAEHAGHVITSATPSLHVLGMWFNFAVSAALIVYFIVTMANELRQRETRLSEYREETLRNEQIVAVATQAAGTAHALGTPLSTMAVLVKELQLEHQYDPALSADLDTLKTQLSLCRDTLRKLVQKADFKQQTLTIRPLNNFIDELMQDWQLLRPEVPCKLQLPTSNSPSLVADPTLEQALINLLNNAADASPTGIDVTVEWQPARWRMQIRDYGKGVPRELAEQLGTTIISSKPDGLGVGLVLSQATLSRLGGSAQLYPQQPSGTLTVVELPLAPHA